MAWSFSEAYAFNGDISEWDTGKVRSLEYTFYDARAFNAGDISKWDTGMVTSMLGTEQRPRIFPRHETVQTSSVNNGREKIEKCGEEKMETSEEKENEDQLLSTLFARRSTNRFMVTLLFHPELF